MRRQSVEVGTLVAQGNGARVGFQSLHDVVTECGRQVEGDEGFAGLGGVVHVDGAGVGDGEHFGEPDGEGDARAGLESVAGLVVEVTEVGDVDLEGTGDFLADFLVVSWC